MHPVLHRLRGLPLLLLVATALAADPAPGSAAGTELTLAAEAQAEVANDRARLVLVVERESADAGELARQIAQALEAGVKAARTQPGVTARNGGYYTHAVTGSDNRLSGYRSRAELILSSSDFAALARVAQQVADQLTIGGMGFELAPETRRQAEAALIGEAVTAFRTRADMAVRALGAQHYRIEALDLGGGSEPAPRPMMRLQAASLAATPVEGGQATVTVTVSGRIRLQD